jgi:hypothetical protein
MDEPEIQLLDFDVIARSHQTLANELPKFRNIPASDTGAAILAEIRAMRQEMNEKFRAVDERFDHSRQRT